MKLKVNVSLLLVLLLVMNQFSFAADLSAIVSYKTNLAADNFTDNYSASDWAVRNLTATKATIGGEDVLEIDITAKGNFLKRITNTVTSGLLVCEFDIIRPEATEWTNSMLIGLINANKDIVSLFNYIPSNGVIRSSIDKNYNTCATLSPTQWCSFRIEFDVDEKSFSVFAGQKGTELTEISGLANNYYAEGSQFEDGVSGLSFYVSGGDALENAYCIDNVNISTIPHAYSKVNSVASADELMSILRWYVGGGYLNFPANYEEFLGKETLWAALSSKEFVSNTELEEFVYSLVDGETVYVDMTPYCSADIIAKKGEIAPTDSYDFGIRASKFTLDRTGLKRDGYDGQGYNGEAISAIQNKDGIITLNRNGKDSVKIKIPQSVMEIGVNDTAILTAATTKTSVEGLGERFHKDKSIVISELAGRKLSTVDVACFATTVNNVWLCADVTYSGGEVVSYYMDSVLPHLNALFGATCWRSEALGKAVELNEGIITDADAISDPNPDDNITPEDNYSNSYISSQRFNLDPDKVIEKFELYNSSVWGSSSVAVLGVTAIPSKKISGIFSESYDFESGSEGWKNGNVETSPTADWNKTYKVSADSKGKLIFAGENGKYLTGDFKIYASKDTDIKLSGSNVSVFKITSSVIGNDGKCDPALCKDANEKWIDVRFSVKNGELLTWIKDGENYFKINSQSIDVSATGLEFEAIGENVYIDDVRINTVSEICSFVNEWESETMMETLVDIICNYELLKMPINFKNLLSNEKERLIQTLLSERYESDDEVFADIEASVINHLCDSTSDELFIYSFEEQYDVKALSGLSLIVNKDVASKDAVIYGVAYKDNELVSLISQKIETDLVRGSKINIVDPLDLSNANRYKFIFVSSDTLYPLCKNINVSFKSGNVDSNYYPGWVRKTITFSYDDGNYTTDEKALNLINAAGMKATFNLYSFHSNRLVNSIGAEELRALYQGHEIASHSKWHTAAIPEEHDYLNMPAYQDASSYYGGQTGIYYFYANYPDLTSKQPRANDEIYKKGIDDCIYDLEKVFGEDKIRGFAYAYSRSSAYKEELQKYVEANHDYARDSRNDADKKGFALPSDWSNWNCTAYYNDLLKNADIYESLEDDGQLKFFCAGVHTADFNKDPDDGIHDSYWYQIEEFCSLYGNRPESYWYATNIEIFDYVNAIKNLKITENGIANNSSVDVYLTIDGKKAVVKAHSIYR